MELKKDDTPENAIKQIRDKEYIEKFIKEYKNYVEYIKKNKLINNVWKF
ncbi:MAG: hypothetical protein RSE41_10250 [Clostridia bacterium]